MGDREATFDIMKGIGILSVLVGHWPGLPKLVAQFIYSFHMPLFFLLAGFFSKSGIGFRKDVAKTAKRLLYPFVFTQLLLVTYCFILGLAKDDFTLFTRSFISLFWGSGDVIDSRFGQIFVGHMWFLPALFFAKVVFVKCQESCRTVLQVLLFSLLLSLFGIVLRKYTISPWSFLQGLSAVFFLAIGWAVKNATIPKWLFAVSILSWPFAIAYSGLEMYGCWYKFYPLDVLGACGGTMCVYFISRLIKQIPVLSHFLVWCGSYSLVILCFHTFEWFSSIAYSLRLRMPFSLSGNAFVCFRYILVFVLTAITIRLPYISEIYGVAYKHFNSIKTK